MTPKPTDPAGERGIKHLVPGQRRKFMGITVRYLMEGGYSLYWASGPYAGKTVWYRLLADALIAVQMNMPVEPERTSTTIVYEIQGKEYRYEQPNWVIRGGRSDNR